MSKDLIFGFVGASLIMASLLIALLLMIHSRKFDPDRDSLRPDLAERILCPGHTVPSDGIWERAFTRLGFRPLNPPALAKKYGIYYPVGGQYIWGLDAEGRILHAYMPSSPYGDISITLISPPPTAHDVQLEAMIRAMIAHTNCNIDYVRTDENKPQARPMFLKILRNVKGWYAEADAMGHRTPGSIRH